MKRVEIIILTCGEPETESKCLDLLIRHTKYPYQITIWDNRGCEALNFSSILWNKLVKESKRDYICIMDSDAYVSEEWLTKLMEVLLSNKKIAVVGPAMGDSKDFKWANDGTVSGYCFLFKKSIFKKIGGFDERFGWYAQECDWMYRVLEAGYKIVGVPEVIVKHGGSITVKNKFTPEEIERQSQIDRKLLLELKNERAKQRENKEVFSAK